MFLNFGWQFSLISFFDIFLLKRMIFIYNCQLTQTQLICLLIELCNSLDRETRSGGCARIYNKLIARLLLAQLIVFVFLLLLLQLLRSECDTIRSSKFGLAASFTSSASRFVCIAVFTASFLGRPRALLGPLCLLLESVIRLFWLASVESIFSFKFKYSSEMKILNEPSAQFI